MEGVPLSDVSNQMRPPCASIMVRLMASPMPVPVALVVAKGSNIRSDMLPAIPGPLSTIEICTQPSSCASAETVICRHPFGVVLSASIALFTRLCTTVSIWIRSISSVTPSHTALVARVMRCVDASSRMGSRALRKNAEVSTGSSVEVPPRKKSRRRCTTVAARAASRSIFSVRPSFSGICRRAA